jgi:hypothetical protein
MTASTTVGGIQQLSAANIQPGAGDFTLSDKVVVMGVNHFFVVKYQNDSNRFYWWVGADNLIKFIAIVGGSTILSFTGADVSGFYGDAADYAVSVVRESSTADGSYEFSVNGAVVSSGSIAAASPVSIDNTGTAYRCMQSSSLVNTRAPCDWFLSRLFNRALTATEVLDLSINGVALADRGASQTPVYESDFSAGTDSAVAGGGVTITGNQDGIGGEDDWLKTERTGGTNPLQVSFPAISFRNNNCKIKAHNLSASSVYFGVFFGTVPVGAQAAEFSVVPAGSSASIDVSGLNLRDNNTFAALITNSSGQVISVPNGTVIYYKDVSVTQIGLTSELIASNAQSNTGQILDSSGNKNHALLPASGATVVGRPVSQTREVRWTNTWDGTNELQYIGGVNQAILPANAYIESIVGTVSGATPHDIIVGDGSDTDRYVTITTGLAAGTTNFALAARITDGTNLKLTVDPDTNATMSIAWVISYRTLE